MMQTKRGGILYCDNPSSDYHIQKIPLVIGDYSPIGVAKNNKNPHLATIDHIYPKKHFKDLRFTDSNVQVLCKGENKRKGGDFVIDYRKLHIQNFLNSTNSDFVLKNWKYVLNIIHQMPIFRQTKGGVPITKMDIIIQDGSFIVRGDVFF